MTNFWIAVEICGVILSSNVLLMLIKQLKCFRGFLFFFQLGNINSKCRKSKTSMVGQVVQFMCYHHRHRPANHSIHALLGLVRLWSKHWVDWYTFILFRCNKLFHFVCNVYTDVKKRITVFKVAYSYFLLYNMNSTRSIGLIQESTQLHLPPDKQGWANKNRQGQNCKSNMLLYRYICIYLYVYNI